MSSTGETDTGIVTFNVYEKESTGNDSLYYWLTGTGLVVTGGVTVLLLGGTLATATVLVVALPTVSSKNVNYEYFVKNNCYASTDGLSYIADNNTYQYYYAEDDKTNSVDMGNGLFYHHDIEMMDVI